MEDYLKKPRDKKAKKYVKVTEQAYKKKQEDKRDWMDVLFWSLAFIAGFFIGRINVIR